MEGKRSPARTTRRSIGGRGPRLAALVLALVAVFATIASTASAHTWSLENDFAASPDGVTVPPNPFADAYGHAAVWAVGYGGGGSYSESPGGPIYSGVTTFTVGPSSDWHGYQSFYFSHPGLEGWIDGTGLAGTYPYLGNNAAATAAGWWPAETVFTHPAPDTAQEQSRGTVKWVSPVTGAVSIEATFASVDCGAGIDGVDYSIDRQAAGSATLTHVTSGAVGHCGSATSSVTYNSGSLSVESGDAYYISVGDGGKGSYEYDSTALTVNISDGAGGITLAAPTHTSAVYKQAMAPVTVTGKDTDGDTVTLSATNLPAGLTFNSSTGVLSGAPTVAAGEYVITLSGSDGHGETFSRHLRLTVEKGQCTLTNKGARLTSLAGASLYGKLVEAVTKAAIPGRQVEFGVFGQQSAMSAAFLGKTGSTGVATVKAALAAEVYEVGAAFRGDGFYNECRTSANEILTVSPATWTSTGAGSVSIGKATSYLGFNAVQVAEGGNPIVILAPTGRFTGGTITTLTKPTATSATWTGTGVWNGEPAEYSVGASDPSIGADTVSIVVSVGGVTRWSTEGAKAIKGDVKVH